MARRLTGRQPRRGGEQSYSPCTDSFASPCRDCQRTSPRLFTSLRSSSPCLFASLISLCLSSLQLSLHLVDITLLILVAIVFSLSWFLFFSFSRSSVCFSLSLHLLLIFSSSSLCLIDTNFPILPVIVFSLPQGGPQADGEATSAREGHHVDIPPVGVCNVGGGTAGGGDLHLPLLE